MATAVARRDRQPACALAFPSHPCSDSRELKTMERFSEFQSEEFRKIAGRQNFPGISSFLCERKLSTGAADEFFFVQLVKPKQELGLAVEARADAVEHGGDMLAHISPVRATARKLNLLWRGEQSIVLSANSLHDSLGKSASQQLHQGINGPGTVLADGFPARLTNRRDFHCDFIDGRAAHKRFHFTEGNLQIDDGTIAHVSAAAGQTICVITVTLQVLAPGFSPESCSNAAAFNLDRRDDMPLFPQLGDLAHRLLLPLRDRHVGAPSPASVVHASHLRLGAV